MALALWIANQGTTAQVVTLTINNATVGGVLNVAINGKIVSYTVVSGDTTTTVATNLQALLAASLFPEFQEIAWTSATNVITATANVAGTPFYTNLAGETWGLSISVASGGSMTLAQTTPNTSPSDINDPKNWLRAGVEALPVANDDIVIADNSTPLLWNLDQLAVPKSFTRWQSFTGSIGLPENNPLGYYEYRPTYLSFAGPGSSSSSSSSSSSGAPAAPITAIIGQGTNGSGPTRERYNFGANQVKWVIRAAGSAADDYSVRVLTTNAATTFQITGVSVGVAMLPNENSTFASATVDGGGTLDLGQNVTVTSMTLYGATANIFCVVPTISMQQSATLSVLSTGQTYQTITAITGCTIVWLSDSNVTSFTIDSATTVDCSQDVRPFTVTTLSILDASTCIWNDPNNRSVINNAVLMGQRVVAGPFVFGSGRTFKIV